MRPIWPSARRRGLAEPRHSARASPALQALTECDPALATLALWCRHRDSAEVELAETRGTEILYGAGFEALPLHQQIGVAGHHILHVALQHSARMAAMATRLGPDFSPEYWQIACDAIVNETILRAGHALPRPVLRLSGLMRTIGAPDDSDGLLSQWDAEQLYHKVLRVGGAGGGEGARSAVLAYAEAQRFRPDLVPGQSEGEEAEGNTRLDAADWRGHLTRAMAAGRAAGVGLGALGAPLGDLPRPQVPWELVLRRLALNATLPRHAPNPGRPARRWLAQAGHAMRMGAELPPWQPRQTAPVQQPRLVVALDSSGSIPPATLRLFLAEITGIVRRMSAELRLIVFDEDIRSETSLNSATIRRTLADLALPEGGGTDFRPVMARAAQLRPAALVLLSDMEGPMGKAMPGLRVIWACPAAEPPRAPFGHVLSLAR